MTNREYAKQWLKINYPSDTSYKLKSSKYFSSKDIWFLTCPTTYFEPEKQGYICILLQYENTRSKFHYLKVPYSFFRNNKNNLNIRRSNDKFDLHISAKQRNWLDCERSNGVSFLAFEQ